MNLHHDSEAFEELIAGAANELHIPANIIEKDYFVSLALKELSVQLKDMVFKGGTSLTKCYQILERFSEDIDISYAAESGPPEEQRKRQLKIAVIATAENLNLHINNLENIKSRRNYNCYCINYPSIYDNSPFLNPELVIETYVALLAFPTTTRMVDNYLYRFLKKIEALHLAEKYNLMPFPITTQSIERTFIDKIFAICDYYLENKVAKHSRHLYDIHKIYTNIEIPENFNSLVENVRAVRSKLPVCPSAQADTNINTLLSEIIENDIYKEDYKNITEELLFSPLSYDEAITSLKSILHSGIWG